MNKKMKKQMWQQRVLRGVIYYMIINILLDLILLLVRNVRIESNFIDRDLGGIDLVTKINIENL
jgi:hypothetical protein